MVFEEIQLKNFATYKGENTIPLSPKDKRKPIILIGGENGCGKTTLLDAFQLALFGPAARCSNRGKLTYEKYLERCINRTTPPDEGTSLKLTFHYFTGGTKHRYTIERRWFVKGKQVKEHFWVFNRMTETLQHEKALADHWADYIEGIFPSQIAPFFFFDGEKIEELADFEKSGHLIHAAIHSLLGLGLVDQLEQDLVTLEKKKHKELAPNENTSIADAIEDEIRTLQQSIEHLKQTEGEIHNTLDKLESELDRAEDSFRKMGGDLYLKRTELEKQLKQLQEELAAQEEQLRDLAAGPAPLLLVQDLLKEIQEQAEKEELAHRESILCEMLEERDQAILKQLSILQATDAQITGVEKFLYSDRNNHRENADVEPYLGMTNETHKDLDRLISLELPNIEKNLPTALNAIAETRAEIETTERALAGVPDESTIAKILGSREELQKRTKEAEISLTKNTEELDRTRRQLETKVNELRRELDRVAQLRFEGKDTRRKIQYASKVRTTLEAFREKVIDKHIDDIESLVLSSFNRLLRKDTLIQRLEIDRDTYQIRLYKEKNEELLPERLSAGERQLLATALLWGICQAAGKPLPTIIDTPLGRLDTSHRTNLVRHYFPMASHQVLLLSTNEEIVGRYYNDLKPFVSHTALLSHNEKAGGTTVERRYFV